jgi:hypothetical protein
MRGLGLTVSLLVVLAAAGGCSRRRPASRSVPAPTSAPATTQSFPGGTFDRPALGVRLDWPTGWVQQPSKEYVLLLSAAGGGGATLSLDVPDLPPHIPGMIPIGSVRGGYLDDLRKSVGRVRTENLSPPAVHAANTRFVRSTWTDEGGTEWQETALLMVHGDRVYILRGRSPVSGERETRGAFDVIIRSLEWTR